MFIPTGDVLSLHYNILTTQVMYVMVVTFCVYWYYVKNRGIKLTGFFRILSMLFILLTTVNCVVLIIHASEINTTFFGHIVRVILPTIGLVVVGSICDQVYKIALKSIPTQTAKDALRKPLVKHPYSTAACFQVIFTAFSYV